MKKRVPIKKGGWRDVFGIEDEPLDANQFMRVFADMVAEAEKSGLENVLFHYDSDYEFDGFLITGERDESRKEIRQREKDEAKEERAHLIDSLANRELPRYSFPDRRGRGGTTQKWEEYTHERSHLIQQRGWDKMPLSALRKLVGKV